MNSPACYRLHYLENLLTVIPSAHRYRGPSYYQYPSDSDDDFGDSNSRKRRLFSHDDDDDDEGNGLDADDDDEDARTPPRLIKRLRGPSPPPSVPKYDNLYQEIEALKAHINELYDFIQDADVVLSMSCA
jgi:hypothetical protein